MSLSKKWAGGRRGVSAALLPVVFFTACAQSWSDPAGRTLSANPGSEHCEMQSATFLGYDGNSYIRDPEHLFSVGDGEIATTYEEDSVLPENATFTGFKKGDAELWSAPGVEAVFVKTDEEVEQWPLSKTGCA